MMSRICLPLTAQVMLFAIVALAAPGAGMPGWRTAAAPAPALLVPGGGMASNTSKIVAAVDGPTADLGARLEMATPGTATAEASSGDVAVTLYDCPAGMRPETLEPERCQVTADPVTDLEIAPLGSGPAAPRNLSDARRDGDALVWDDLPFDEYFVWARSVAEGYDRFRIPDLEGLNTPPELGYTASPNEGYIVPLSADSPVADLPVDFFHAP